MISAFLHKLFRDQTDLSKIIKNLGWLIFDKFLRMGVGLLVGVWVARYLGPQQFGVFNYAIAFIGFFSAISGLGLNGIVVRNIVRDPESAKITFINAFALQVISGLFSTILVCISIEFLKKDDEFIKLILLILSLSLTLKSTDSIKYWYEAQIQTRYVVWIENASFVIISLAKVILILMSASLISFVYVALAETLITSIGLIWLYTVHNGLPKFINTTWNSSINLIKEGWPLLLSAVSVSLYMRIDVIMLEAITSSREVGIYAAATRISEIFYFLPMVIISSVGPKLISNRALNVDLYFKQLRMLYFTMTWLAIVLTLPVVILAEPIVVTLFGSEFSDSVPVLIIHMWANVAVFLGVASSQHLIIEHLQVLSFYRTILGLITNILLNIFLIPEMGAQGAAISTVISYFISVFSLFIFKSTNEHAKFIFRSTIKRV